MDSSRKKPTTPPLLTQSYAAYVKAGRCYEVNATVGHWPVTQALLVCLAAPLRGITVAPYLSCIVSDNISARIVARMHSKRARPTRSTSNDRALREYKSHLLRLKQLCPPNARSSAVAERPRVIRVVNDFAKSPKVVKGHWHCCRSIHDKI